MKQEYFDNSMKIGRPVFRQMGEGRRDAGPDAGSGAASYFVSSDCPIASRHIMQGMGEDADNAVRAHPLTLLRKAYGI